MKEEYIEQMLAAAGRHGALRRGVEERCGELDSRLTARATECRRHYRLSLAALVVLLVVMGGVNMVLVARQGQTLRCNSACNTQELLTAADGVIASCRQNTTI